MKALWTLGLLLVAVAMDFRTGKVRNWLICLGVVSGILLQTWELGIRGLCLSVAQMIFPVIILFLFFLMRALGAGDIKLFSMIGSLWDWKTLCDCMLFSFLVGGVASLALLLRQKILFARLMNFGRYVRETLQTGKIGVYERHADGKRVTLHFSIAIFMGFCITLGVVN